MRALVDSDVLIAVIDGTEAQSPASRQAMTAAVLGRFDAYITPLIAANVMYVLKRKWRTSRPKTWKTDITHAMTGMLSTMRMISVNERDFLSSFASPFTDKEDGIQYFAALRSKPVDLIITCNAKDYIVFSQLPVLEPGQFVKEHLAQ